MVWLEELLTRMPNGTQKVVVFMPVNHVALPKPLSPLDQLESACKSQAISISKRTHSVLLDFRIPSSLTDNDSHFWDELHHRTYVSDDIIDRIGDVLNKKPRQQSDLFNLYLPDLWAHPHSKTDTILLKTANVSITSWPHVTCRPVEHCPSAQEQSRNNAKP